jgi:putative ABC transport system permease protein
VTVSKANMLTADTMASQMLNLKLLAGSLERTTQNRWSLLVTRSYAARMFPWPKSIGRIIHEIPTFSSEPAQYEITGLIEDLPYNSHLRTDVDPSETHKVEPMINNGMIIFWNKLPYAKTRHGHWRIYKKGQQWYAAFYKKQQAPVRIPAIARHLSAFGIRGRAKGISANARTIYIFAGVALLLLFIACVNFVNLSTAKAFARVKEAGVRKCSVVRGRNSLCSF